MKVPPELIGKRLQCKKCLTTFAAEAKPIKFEEEGGPAAYGVHIEKDESRCPGCAKPLETEGAVICLNCGYNVRTRERLQTRRVHDTTQQDYIAWLAPGVVCIVVVVVCLLSIGWLWLYWEKWLDAPKDKKDDFTYMIMEPVRTLGSVALGFVTFFAGRFAIQRLLKNPHPPEIEKGDEKEDDEEEDE
jgi:hypothetical protein